jgi:hypothetical protein
VQVNIWKLCKITMQGQILLLYLFICYIILLSFFVVKPIKPINMKSNVCNSLNYKDNFNGNFNMTSFFRFLDKRAIYRWYNLIRTCTRECDWPFRRKWGKCMSFDLILPTFTTEMEIWHDTFKGILSVDHNRNFFIPKIIVVNDLFKLSLYSYVAKDTI